jgi:hypothetical protein
MHGYVFVDDFTQEEHGEGEEKQLLKGKQLGCRSGSSGRTLA